MVDRIQITVTTYMPLDGQWQIVLPGTIVDVPSANAYRGSSIAIAETPAALASHGKPTSVRSARTR